MVGIRREVSARSWLPSAPGQDLFSYLSGSRSIRSVLKGGSQAASGPRATTGETNPDRRCRQARTSPPSSCLSICALEKRPEKRGRSAAGRFSNGADFPDHGASTMSNQQHSRRARFLSRRLRPPPPGVVKKPIAAASKRPHGVRIRQLKTIPSPAAAGTTNTPWTADSHRELCGVFRYHLIASSLWGYCAGTYVGRDDASAA